LLASGGGFIPATYGEIVIYGKTIEEKFAIETGKPSLLKRNEYIVDNPTNANLGALKTDVGILAPSFSQHVAGQGDYDADGKSDIFWRNTITGQNFIYLMEGLNIKARKVLNYVTGSQWELRGSSDFNGDGKGDVLWRRVDRGH
jgi:hypothetical protein